MRPIAWVCFDSGSSDNPAANGGHDTGHPEQIRLTNAVEIVFVLLTNIIIKSAGASLRVHAKVTGPIRWSMIDVGS
jgi:hypothetical protein